MRYCTVRNNAQRERVRKSGEGQIVWPGLEIISPPSVSVHSSHFGSIHIQFIIRKLRERILVSMDTIDPNDIPYDLGSLSPCFLEMAADRHWCAPLIRINSGKTGLRSICALWEIYRKAPSPFVGNLESRRVTPHRQTHVHKPRMDIVELILF